MDKNNDKSNITKPEGEYLKSFFVKLVDARPSTARAIYRTLMHSDEWGGLSKAERRSIKVYGMERRMHLMVNPAPQNGNSSTDESDLS